MSSSLLFSVVFSNISRNSTRKEILLYLVSFNSFLHIGFSRLPLDTGRKKAGRGNEQSALGSMCDAEKDWHERSFRASGAINGCRKSPLNKPEMTFSFFIFKPPVTSF